MGLLNTFAAVILATTSKTLAFALVILRPMFLQVPSELEEAAYLDGCTRFQAFWRIVLPLMRAPLLVVGAICFAQAYGPVRIPDHAAESAASAARLGRHLCLYRRGIRRLASGDGFASIYVLPILALFLLLQRNIVSGLTAGSAEVSVVRMVCDCAVQDEPLLVDKHYPCWPWAVFADSKAA
jgi:multiple sugar transport system permease protein